MVLGRVRRMERNDIEGALAVTDSVAAERLWIQTEPGFNRQLFASRWRARIDDASRAMLVAEADGRIVGFGDVYAVPELGHVLGMFVHKEYRGRGIGKLLLAALVDWARQNGLPSISLHVFAHNSRAIALYKSAGFIEVRHDPEHSTRQNGEVWAAIVMSKNLV